VVHLAFVCTLLELLIRGRLLNQIQNLDNTGGLECNIPVTHKFGLTWLVSASSAIGSARGSAMKNFEIEKEEYFRVENYKVTSRLVDPWSSENCGNRLRSLPMLFDEQ
jgi:hypothetical protein